MAEAFPMVPEIGSAVTLACLLEVAAPKVGNVSRRADFEDLTFGDFVRGSVAVGDVFRRDHDSSTGRLILSAVDAMLRATNRNTHLGTILLLGPLARLHGPPQKWPEEIADVLSRLGADDARDIFEAIRMAAPGGMGRVETHDLAGPPPPNILAAMRFAEDRDTIARQYSRGFSDIWKTVLPALRTGRDAEVDLDRALVWAQLTVLAAIPDTLIARKCGIEVAQHASNQAARALTNLPQDQEAYWHAVGELDFWLRSDGHRRNPGTTADLLAAGIFLMLRSGELRATHPASINA